MPLPPWEALQYFHAMLVKHLDLVERRLLRHEPIPAAEKKSGRAPPAPTAMTPSRSESAWEIAE